MPAWTALAEGDDLSLPPGALVAVIASVKASHSAADLQAFASQHGITLTDYAEEGQRPGLGPDPRGPGYRYIAAAGTVGAGGLSLPWSVPFPLSIVDGSGLVEAWQGDASSGTAPAPSGPVAPPRVVPPPGAGLALAGFVAAALALAWHRKEHPEAGGWPA
jgi:hypothetical protein